MTRGSGQVMEDIGIFRRIREEKPLIHCITNYVTANDVANMILAAGGSAVMADGEQEVEDISAISKGLVINMGTLKKEAVPAMVKAGRQAAALGHPVVFDPVGAGASRFRTEACRRVFKETPITLIRGNASELRAMDRCLREEKNDQAEREDQQRGKTEGVDVSGKDKVTEENLEENIRFAEEFAKSHGIMVLMSGSIDIAADGRQAFLVRNGTPAMARITGAGCMLDGLAALFLAASRGEKGVYPAALAAAAESLCGEQAEKLVKRMEDAIGIEPGPSVGMGSFRVYLMDAMSRLDDETLKEGMKIEIC